LEILPRSITLEKEESFENLELVECRWKDNLTLPYVYWVMFLIWTLGCSGWSNLGCAAPSRIQSSKRDIFSIGLLLRQKCLSGINLFIGEVFLLFEIGI